MKFEVQVLVLQIVVSIGLIIFSPLVSLEKYELMAAIVGLGLFTMASLLIKYFADVRCMRKTAEVRFLETERNYVFNLNLNDIELN